MKFRFEMEMTKSQGAKARAEIESTQDGSRKCRVRRCNDEVEEGRIYCANHGRIYDSKKV